MNFGEVFLNVDVISGGSVFTSSDLLFTRALVISKDEVVDTVHDRELASFPSFRIIW